MGALVIEEHVGPIAVLTLNRAERHNSLVPELLDQLLAALDTIGQDPDTRVVVLQAQGRSFSTGGDLAAFRTHLDDVESYGSEIVGLLNQVILALVQLPHAVVAAVHGIVTGGSLGLVLGCDVVLVAPEASFTPYYSVIGFAPDGGWTAMLPAIIGSRRAAEVLLCDLSITAEQAVSWGLASRIVPASRIRDEALTVAREISARKAGSLRHTKRLLTKAFGDISGRLEAERTHFVQQIATEEARHGIVAYLESRKLASSAQGTTA